MSLVGEPGPLRRDMRRPRSIELAFDRGINRAPVRPASMPAPARGRICVSSRRPTDACAPDLDAPGLDAPGLDAPGLDASGLDASGLDASGLDASGLDASGLDASGLDAPSLDAPSLDAPSLDAPSLDAPSLDAPPRWELPPCHVKNSRSRGIRKPSRALGLSPCTPVRITAYRRVRCSAARAPTLRHPASRQSSGHSTPPFPREQRASRASSRASP